jgi:hypothetical protein
MILIIEKQISAKMVDNITIEKIFQQYKNKIYRLALGITKK